MNKLASICFCALMLVAGAVTVRAESGSTLRIDYMFTGGPGPTVISIHGMSRTDGWYGRNCNMDRTPVTGNGEIVMKDVASGKTLYAMSFSTLFQEWLTTPESDRVTRSFENTFLLPMPESKASVCVRLFDNHGAVTGECSHDVDPSDILIEKKSGPEVRTKYISRGGSPHDCIDVVILAEGYTPGERAEFFRDAAAAVDAIFSHEPFGRYRESFNFLAVAPGSEQSGVSVPREGKWFNTAVKSNFDTFYIERYLTTSHVFAMHDLLSGLPYEHIIILANTDVYGGGGIYNSYTLTTAHHKLFRQVVVHEFGHSFGALADEYDYDSYGEMFYFPTEEPWEQNITTKHDFTAKWADMIDAGVPGVALFEGAGYQSKGVWRPVEDCRMRSNLPEGFCPVCQRALERMIQFNTVQEHQGPLPSF